MKTTLFPLDKSQGITITLDFKAIERKNISFHYWVLHGEMPTEKQLDEFIVEFFPDHNTKTF